MSGLDLPALDAARPQAAVIDEQRGDPAHRPGRSARAHLRGPAARRRGASSSSAARRPRRAAHRGAALRRRRSSRCAAGARRSTPGRRSAHRGRTCAVRRASRSASRPLQPAGSRGSGPRRCSPCCRAMRSLTMRTTAWRGSRAPRAAASRTLPPRRSPSSALSRRRTRGRRTARAGVTLCSSVARAWSSSPGPSVPRGGALGGGGCSAGLGLRILDHFAPLGSAERCGLRRRAQRPRGRQLACPCRRGRRAALLARRGVGRSCSMRRRSLMRSCLCVV